MPAPERTTCWEATWYRSAKREPWNRSGTVRMIVSFPTGCCRDGQGQQRHYDRTDRNASDSVGAGYAFGGNAVRGNFFLSKFVGGVEVLVEGFTLDEPFQAGEEWMLEARQLGTAWR